MANATFAPAAAQGRALSALETLVVAALRAGAPYSSDSDARRGELRAALRAAGFIVERGVQVYESLHRRGSWRNRGTLTLAARAPNGDVVAIEDGRSNAKIKSLEKVLATRRISIPFGDGHSDRPRALFLALLADVPAVVAQDVVVFGLLGAA